MNFLFLSKLLPLFIYPLGLSCLLLLIGLILGWKMPQYMPIPVGLALIILYLSSNVWVSNSLVKSLEWQYLPTPDIPQADAIVVLGGATRSTSYPRIIPDLSEQGDRVVSAAKLYKDQKAPLIIASGGRIEWKGGGTAEAEDIKKLLQIMGISPDVILVEPKSLNTHENAVEVKKILNQRGLNRVLLVTSALHTPRAIAIFRKEGINAIPAPTDYLISQQDLEEPTVSRSAIILNLLPDSENLDRTTKALKEYIGTLIYKLKGWL